MDIYLSPIYVIFAGLFITILFSSFHISTALIAIASFALVFYTLYLHTAMFSAEYNSLTTAAWVQSVAPTLMLSAVLIMSISYIIFFFKKDVKTNYKQYISGQSATSWNPIPVIPKISSWNPFASKSNTTMPSSYNKTTTGTSGTNLTHSERRNYISALDRLI